VSVNLFADGYKIKVKINGVSDTIAYLGNHYGDKKYAIDTTVIDKNGVGVFQGNKNLEGGIYLVLLPSRGMTYFELLVDNDQDFYLETDTINFVEHMKVSGSVENKLFYEFQNKMVKLQEKGMELQKLLQKVKDNKDSTKIVKDQLLKLTEEKDEYWNKLITDKPKAMLAVMLKAMQDPVMPEFDIPKDCTNPDSLKRAKTYFYNKDHYFDNIDFTDSRILRTPIFHNKLDTYMKKMILQHPDTIIKEGDRLVKFSEPDTNMFRYMLVYMLGYYEKTKIMGMDKVFVFFGENYYLTDKAYWADSSLKAKIAERVIALKPNLMGQKAPNIKLETIDGRPMSLWDIKAEYTILYFFEPSCGHCKKVTPKLLETYHKYKKHNVEVFAIFTQHDRKEWQGYIDKYKLDWINVYDKYNYSNFRKKYDIYSTPVIYMLNDKKEIIAKRLDFEQIDEMLKHLLGLTDEEDKKDDKEEKTE
jgi:peroxiredoxin